MKVTTKKMKPVQVPAHKVSPGGAVKWRGSVLIKLNHQGALDQELVWFVHAQDGALYSVPPNTVMTDVNSELVITEVDHAGSLHGGQ